MSVANVNGGRGSSGREADGQSFWPNAGPPGPQFIQAFGSQASHPKNDGPGPQLGKLDHKRSHWPPARPVDVAITHGHLLLDISSCPPKCIRDLFRGK